MAQAGAIPVYMRAGDSAEHLIGSVTLDAEPHISPDGTLSVRAVGLAAFLRAAADEFERLEKQGTS